MLAIVLILAGAGAWWALHDVSPPSQTAAGPQSSSADIRPTVAVLPLVSLAEGTKDDYFADGLTEDIISALGRFSEFTVRSHNAVFAYKGKNPRPEEVGRDLDVRYVVEGSIRRSPERIRISVRLTAAARNALLWSENYDVAPNEIFSVDVIYGHNITGENASWITIGTTIRFPPPESRPARERTGHL